MSYAEPNDAERKYLDLAKGIERITVDEHARREIERVAAWRLKQYEQQAEFARQFAAWYRAQPWWKRLIMRVQSWWETVSVRWKP